MHPRIHALIDAAKNAAGTAPPTMAVVYAIDRETVQAVHDACSQNIIAPVLVGPAARAKRLALEAGIDTNGWRFVDTDDAPHVAANTAVALAKNGEVASLAKGSLHSDDLLRAVNAKSSGLHTDSRLSHCFWFDVPAYEKPLMIADCVVNVSPNTIKKKAIIGNAVRFAQALGVTMPKVAILSAVETPTPAIPTTIEAAELIAWCNATVPNVQIDGPFAFDNAISKRAAQVKGITSPVAGDADILIAPNVEAGNILYKSLVYMAGAQCAGLVLGAKVPIVLVSRADSPLARVGSCALAVLARPTQ